MTQLISMILELQVNLYRVQNGMVSIPSSDITCIYARERLQETITDFSHTQFRLDHPNGVWYENLGRIPGTASDYFQNSQIILDLWKKSPKHNQILLSPMKEMCIQTNGNNYVLNGKQDTDN